MICNRYSIPLLWMTCSKDYILNIFRKSIPTLWWVYPVVIDLVMTVRYFGMRFSRLLYEQEPVERKLGQRIVSATRRSKHYFKCVWDYVYDVPLLSLLHQLLSDPFVLDEVQFAYWILFAVHHQLYVDATFRHWGDTRQDGLLSDHCDGTAYKCHPSYLLMCPHWKLWCITTMLRYVIPLDHEQSTS